MISVVIPAHDEEATIGDCLDRLLAGSPPGSLEIVVACNGCSDRTAEVARSRGAAVRVVETPVRSKISALNLGDRAATDYPRFYVDADVRMTFDTVAQLAAAMTAGAGLVGAPRIVVDVTGRPWAVRAHFAVWSTLPYVRDGLVGSGVYALTKEGRARFGAFPDIIADDFFVRNQFGPAERVQGTGTFTVPGPWRYRDLVRRNVRVFAGNDEYRERFGESNDSARGSGRHLLWLLLSRPSMAPAIAVYVTGTAIAKLRARRRLRRGSAPPWSAHR